MANKTKKPNQSWLKCEKCESNINQRESEHHSLYCPPSVDNFQHSFILRGNFYGYLNVKTNEDIKGISNHDKNNLVFLSQTAIQLLHFEIGEWAVIKKIDDGKTCARIVWPTTEKTLSSIMVTQKDFDSNWNSQVDARVCVGKFDKPTVKNAKEIVLTASKSSKNLPPSPELLLRIKNQHSGRMLAIDNKIGLFFYGKELEFHISNITASINEPDRQGQVVKSLLEDFDELRINENVQFYKVENSTHFRIAGSELSPKDHEESNNLENIGGCKLEIEEIKDLVEVALGKTVCVEGTKPTRGILLYGPPGSGKTLIVKSIAKYVQCHVVSIGGTDMYKHSGQIERSIEELFEEAIDNAPSIILLDELDLLCPTRSSRTTEQEKRTIAALLKHMDRSGTARVCVLATSNRPDHIDPSFRRSGRIDREIEVSVPDPNARYEILTKILSRSKHIVDPVSLKRIADSCYGFVGSDLESLCSRAAVHAIKRRPANPVIDADDLKYASSRVRASAMREVQIEVANVRWSDVGGQEDLKLVMKQAVEWPLKHPESFIRMGITPPRGVLMFGPPGCSKTMIAKAVATESGLNFLSIKGPELFSKWVGESERAVREVFRKARQVAPSVVFFDEIDAVGGERSTGASGGGSSVQERVLAQLLTELDGVTPLGDVTVLAATNRPDRIDKALLRPGRLDRIVYVPLPDEQTRREIFQIKLSRMPVDSSVQIEDLVRKTKGYSGAEVQAVCHEAAMKALEKDIEAKVVSGEHFDRALDIVTPRTPQSLLNIYEEYIKKS